MRKVIITAAVCGGLQSRDVAPYLPEQPEEVAQAAVECWEAGASVVHIHARDKQGKVTADPDIHRDINQRVRSRCDIIVNNSTGVGPGTSFEERIGVLEAMPDTASFNMGSMVRTKFNPGSLFINTREQIETMAKTMLDKGIKPEMEVFGQPMFSEVRNLIDKGLVKPPYWLNLIIGSSNQGAIPATVKDVLSMFEYVRQFPEDTVCSVTVIGRNQLQLTSLGCLLGGHIRVGMEDNIYLDAGQKASSNVDFVERTRRIIELNNKRPATPEETRAMLGLRSRQACMDYALQFSARPDRCG